MNPEVVASGLGPLRDPSRYPGSTSIRIPGKVSTSRFVPDASGRAGANPVGRAPPGTQRAPRTDPIRGFSGEVPAPPRRWLRRGIARRRPG